MQWNQGIIKKSVLQSFNSAFLYSFSACKKGTTILKTSVHSKLMQLPVKTSPGQQKHIQKNFSKYIGRRRSCKSQQIKECLDEQKTEETFFRPHEITCSIEKAILNSLKRWVQPLPKTRLLQSQYSLLPILLQQLSSHKPEASNGFQ